MKKLILASIAVLSLAACNRDNDDPISNIREASEDSALQLKNFTSACSIQPIDAVLTGILTGGQASIKSAVTQYRFEGANVDRRTIMFESGDCTGSSAATFTESGSFDIITDNKTADSGTFIDIEYKKLMVKIDSDAGAQAASAVNLCGTNNWANGAEAEVTAKSADATCYGAQVPRKVANVYKVESDVLYLGTPTKDAVAASVRPTALDTGVKYTAQ